MFFSTTFFLGFGPILVKFGGPKWDPKLHFWTPKIPVHAPKYCVSCTDCVFRVFRTEFEICDEKTKNVIHTLFTTLWKVFWTISGAIFRVLFRSVCSCSLEGPSKMENAIRTLFTALWSHLSQSVHYIQYFRGILNPYTIYSTLGP